ncbi:hypothetical protein BOTBODRAFT_113766 [Botryobasidium botryosum FD-172 SS1]|uniref:G-protein coupled receptors family 3 profile domain-containing protein n=1 Tax=Botryobasidium botryosum (strain FD-172 SS1) TaxID=930990 RepID=A0A067M7Y8_BOTB1|nr:hypothetical protein BOTBODRAFT_113766 [Botryobasidium botryosum FD-172 SS1]
MASLSYWTSPATLGRSFEVVKLLCFVCIGLILCDTLHFASFDWALIRGDRKRRWPYIPYLLVKVVWYLYSALNLAMIFAPTEIDYQGVMDGIEFCMGIIIVCCSSESLLAGRTVCVYSGTTRKVVSVVLIILGAALMVTWMAGVLDARVVWTAAAAQPWSTGGCIYVKVETRYFIKYLATIIFNFTVLILTTVGVRRVGSPPIGVILINHGLIYFLITTFANLVICILTLLRISPLMSLAGAVSSSCVSIMAATRLYVYLADETRPEDGSATTTHQLSPSVHSAPRRAISFIRNAAMEKHGAAVLSGGATDADEDVEKAERTCRGMSEEQVYEVYVGRMHQEKRGSTIRAN